MSRLIWLQAYPPFHRGRYEESQRWIGQALVLVSSQDSELRAHLLNDFSVLENRLGRHDIALKYHQEVLAIRQKVLGETDADTVWSLTNVGANSVDSLGHVDEGLETLNRAFAIYKGRNEGGTPAMARVLDCLCTIYLGKNDYSNALVYSQQALRIRQETQGEKHPDTTRSLRQLTTVLRSSGNQDRLLENFEKILNVRREVLGREAS